MTHRTMSLLLVAAVVAVLAPLPAVGQGQAEIWEPPRLGDGRPDLQGVWDFRTATPLERPAQFGDRETLTEEEAASVEAFAGFIAQAADRQPPEGNVGAYNAFWLDFGTTVGEDRRSSLIVEPANGRLPALADGVATQVGSLDEDLPGEYPWRVRSAGLGADGPEDRGLAERCLLGFNAGPPMMPSAYNNNMQLFQNAGHVVILNEMVHDARVIPLDNSPHLSNNVRQWHGDSRGRWDGDTLVVETRNFLGATSLGGSSATMHLVERFTRRDANTLIYEFTVSDPTTWAGPWTAQILMTKNDEPLYEYACHEGNYGMVNALSGARAEEAASR